MLFALDKSLASEEGFAEVKACLNAAPLAKLIVWGLLSALLYHLVAGVRHLIMDMGVGESLEGGKLGSKIVIAVSAVIIVLVGCGYGNQRNQLLSRSGLYTDGSARFCGCSRGLFHLLLIATW